MPTTTTYTPEEILAYDHCPHKVPVTIASNLSLAKGTVLGRVTASGLYKAYSDGASDGTEVASGVLAEAVNTTSSGTNQATEAAMYVEGAFVESKLTGLDANGKGDLNGRSIPGRDIFKF